jgi:glycosyltransferase involved in cell wall biosynthesis
MLDHPLVHLVGEIDDRQKSQFLGDAMALLFPIDWCEPFGLVMIEAMSCGTPVIAWPHGSVPEVIDDGVTGCIVSSVEAAAAAVPRARAMDRAAVRRRFEQRFTAHAMARGYVDVYEALLAEDDVLPTLPLSRHAAGLLSAQGRLATA